LPKFAQFIPFMGLALYFGALALLSFGSSDPAMSAREAPISSTGIRVPKLGYALKEPVFRGAVSCAAASCHGGGQPGKVGSEYNTWIEKDPHSRAYGVLFNDQSKVIARNMRLVKRTAEIVPAHKEGLCLKCHALNVEPPDRVPVETATGEPSSVSSPEVFAVQGVSCESCHGGAGNYLTTHFQPPFLSKTTREKAEQHGLYPTKDLAFRVALCASCHVGNEHQDVNHDLFAAGHPPFRFEYTGYHNKPAYQPHWTEKAYGDDFEVRAWAIGQVATARDAVDRLRARAELVQRDEKPKAPWPELAEYSCFACHKNLNPKGSWLPLTTTNRAPGALAWGRATMALLPLLAEKGELFGFGAKPKLTELDELRKLMEIPRPDSEKVAKQSKTVLKELDDWLMRWQQAAERNPRYPPFSPEQIVRLFREVASHALTSDTSDAKFNNLDGDSAVLYFDSLTALERGERKCSGKPIPADLSKNLEAFRKQITPPPGYYGPRDQEPSEILRILKQLKSTPLSSELRP